MDINVNLHSQPYKAIKNNRKMTLGRMKMEENAKVQSIPIWGQREDKDGRVHHEFQGWKYIFHK